MNNHRTSFFSGRLLIAAWFVTGLLATPAFSQNAEEIRQKLASTYANLNVMGASFVQTADSDFMESPERFTGTLIFSGKRYRIQTGQQTIVTDGTTLWIYNLAEKQVIVNDYVEDESSFSLTTFLGKLDTAYEGSLEGTEQRQGVLHDVLNLSPIDFQGQFRSVRLSVRRSDSVVTHLVVVDLNDVTMTFDLSMIVINPSITTSTFSFVIPSDVEVVDLRN